MKRSLLIPAVLLLMSLAASAQKLPNIQEVSLRTSVSIKVDGKPTEWNNQFQAYNKATEIFYNMSNDNNNLYLTVQATDLDIINKIICGGVTLTVNGSGKMKDQGGMAVTFPYLNIDRQHFENKVGFVSSPPINLDKPESLQADSFMVLLNKEIISKTKDIKIERIKEIADPLISIYNPQGIKAAALVDNKTVLTCELAVPLKYLGLSIKDSKSFVYNIKLFGMNADMADDGSISSAVRAQRWKIRENYVFRPRSGAIFEGPDAPRLYSVISPTDFWGQYTLAK